MWGEIRDEEINDIFVHAGINSIDVIMASDVIYDSNAVIAEFQVIPITILITTVFQKQ